MKFNIEQFLDLTDYATEERKSRRKNRRKNNKSWTI